MRRLRLKADGRIVELRDGQEFPLVPTTPVAALATTSVAPATAPDRVRFGVLVTLRNEGGAGQSFRLVGEDEADAAHGLLSWVSPLGQALLGHEVGDTVRFQTRELEILRLGP